MKLLPWNSMVLLVSSLVLYIIVKRRSSRTPVLNLEEKDISKYMKILPLMSFPPVKLPHRGVVNDDGDALHIIPLDDILETLSNRTLVTLYNNFLTNIHVLCRNKTRIGGVTARGWDICLDGHYNIQKNNCLVYSFGMNTYTSDFDNGMIDTYNCTVHAYDPGMKTVDSNRSQHIHVHRTGISPVSREMKRGLKMQTLRRIREENKHENAVINMMRIDVEGYEWRSLQLAMMRGSLDGVKQIAVEFHNFGPERRANYKTRLAILRDIYNSGYRIFWTQSFINPYCLFTSVFDGKLKTRCHRVHFLKWLTY